MLKKAIIRDERDICKDFMEFASIQLANNAKVAMVLNYGPHSTHFSVGAAKVREVEEAITNDEYTKLWNATYGALSLGSDKRLEAWQYEFSADYAGDFVIRLK